MAEQEETPTTTYKIFNSGDGDGAEAAVLKKGKWTEDEDEKLRRAVVEYGVENWVAIEKYSGLARQSKSCRLRWINHLRPNLKKGPFTEEEERIIIKLHFKYGNKWSRIASKIPGRTDNEIKNFWHKRVKKCRKHHRLIYPVCIEDDDEIPANIDNTNNEKHYAADEINVDDECWLDGNCTPTNYPDNTIHSHSHSIHLLDRSQYSSHNLPNTTHFQTQQASISPRPLITSPQDEQHYHNSTQRHFRPNAQLQSLVETSSPIQGSPLMQQGVANALIKPFRNTQILSSPKGKFRRFHRATSLLSPRGHSVSPSTSSMLDSSTMESPRSSFKPKLLTHVSSLPSLQISTTTATSTSSVPPLNLESPTSVTSLSGLKLDSPTPAPVSPLKFQSSTSAASDFCFHPNLSNVYSSGALNPSTAAPTLSSSNSKPVPLSLDLQPIQPSPSHSFQVTNLNPSFTLKSELPSIQFSSPPELYLHKAKSDGNLEVLDAQKAAQAKARFRRKNLRQSRISNKKLKEISRKEDTSRASTKADDKMDRALDRYSNKSSRRECLPSSSSRTEATHAKNSTRDLLKIISHKNSVTSDLLRDLLVESASQENVLCELLKSENPSYMPEVLWSQNPNTEEPILGESSETNILSDKRLHREMDSIAENMTFQEQAYEANLLDPVNRKTNTNTPLNLDGTLHPIQLPAGNFVCEFRSRECPSSKCSQIFYSQESFSMEDLFGQNSGTEQVPVFDAFGPLYSQSTTTTLLKSGDEIGKLSCLQPIDDEYFRSGSKTKYTDSLVRKFTEEQSRQKDDGEKLELHESNLLYHQYPTVNLIESGCVVTDPSIKSELQEVRAGSGTECSSSKNLETRIFLDQSFYPERLMATQEQKPLTDGVVPAVSQNTITH
ncbi:unnamed protein product [Fraxinus pennsylvanica]|uniref:Uncharacterized protein n=1 Tax=Fraxinus pennsylvanica TaxID=56036 RepID=A0AAD1YUL3_9LAMI|nr:unnamed protein product [Fraxinus pennsylvanica]